MILALIVISELYILNSGGVLLTLVQALKVIGITILCCLSSSLTMLFFVSFLKNEQTLSLLSTIVGTMIGFVTGAYIPMGIMPSAVQMVSNVIPASQGASLLRKIFLEQPMNQVFAGSTTAINEYSKMQGVDLYFSKTELTSGFMIAFIVGSIIVFAIINIIRFRKMKNN